MGKHVHAEFIKAWADGAEIQVRLTDKSPANFYGVMGVGIHRQHLHGKATTNTG